MRDTRIYFVLPIVALLLLLTACGERKVVVANPVPVVVATAPAPPSAVVVTVPSPPPAPVENVTSVSPGPEYVFVPGYYNWNGSQYEWIAGNWVRTTRPGLTWVPAHWEPTTGGYRWVSGTWR